MLGFLKFFDRLNLFSWVAGLFLVHAIMYLLLGTPNWFLVTLYAVGTWTLLLVILKGVSSAVLKGRDTI